MIGSSPKPTAQSVQSHDWDARATEVIAAEARKMPVGTAAERCEKPSPRWTAGCRQSNVHSANPGLGCVNAKANKIDERYRQWPRLILPDHRCFVKLTTGTAGRQAGSWQRRSVVQPPSWAAAPETGHVWDGAGCSACLFDCGSLRCFVPLRSSTLANAYVVLMEGLE
jgi:hypothetical protein